MPRALLTHPETPCRALKFRAMATREHVHKLVDELPDAALGPVAEFIAARGGSGTGEIIDQWGNLDAMLDGAADDLMADLDEQEIATSGETLADAWARKGHGPR